MERKEREAIIAKNEIQVGGLGQIVGEKLEIDTEKGEGNSIGEVAVERKGERSWEERKMQTNSENER